MNYKLLATDMDGTLLRKNKALSNENIQALRRAKDRGVEIAICTGRPYATVKPYLKQLDFDCWVITNNGAVIRNKTGDIISIVYMKTQVLKEVIEILAKENIYFHISDEKYTYIRSNLERMKKIHKFILETGTSKLKAKLLSMWFVLFSGNHKKVDLSTFVSSGKKAVNVFILSENKHQLQKIKNKLKDIKGIDITSSGFDNIEILDEKATKGKALQQLSKILNIHPGEIIAVGDNYNDLSMIEYAGLGVAMENAEKFIVERADWVTKSNEEDGIAYLIKKFIEVPPKTAAFKK